MSNKFPKVLSQKGRQIHRRKDLSIREAIEGVLEGATEEEATKEEATTGEGMIERIEAMRGPIEGAMTDLREEGIVVEEIEEEEGGITNPMW